MHYVSPGPHVGRGGGMKECRWGVRSVFPPPRTPNMDDVYADSYSQAFIAMVCSSLPHGARAVSLLAVGLASVLLLGTTGVVLWHRKSLDVGMRFPWLVTGQTVSAFLWMYLQLLATGTVVLPASPHMSGVCESITVATYSGGFMLWCFHTCVWMHRHAVLPGCWEWLSAAVIAIPVVLLLLWGGTTLQSGFQALPCENSPCALHREARDFLMWVMVVCLVVVTVAATTTVTAGDTFGMNQGVWSAMFMAFMALIVCVLSVLVSKGGTGTSHEIGVVYNVCTAVVVSWYNTSEVLDVCIKSLRGVKTDLGLVSILETMARLGVVGRGGTFRHPYSDLQPACLKLSCEPSHLDRAEAGAGARSTSRRKQEQLSVCISASLKFGDRLETWNTSRASFRSSVVPMSESQPSATARARARGRGRGRARADTTQFSDHPVDGVAASSEGQGQGREGGEAPFSQIDSDGDEVVVVVSIDDGGEVPSGPSAEPVSMPTPAPRHPNRRRHRRSYSDRTHAPSNLGTQDTAARGVAAASSQESAVSWLMELTQGGFLRGFQGVASTPRGMAVLLCIPVVNRWVCAEWKQVPHLVACVRFLVEVARWRHEFPHDFYGHDGKVCTCVDFMRDDAMEPMRATVLRANQIMNTFLGEALECGRYDWDSERVGGRDLLAPMKAWLESVTGTTPSWRESPQNLVPRTSFVVPSFSEIWEAQVNSARSRSRSRSPGQGLEREAVTCILLNLEGSLVVDRDQLFAAMVDMAKHRLLERQKEYLGHLGRNRATRSKAYREQEQDDDVVRAEDVLDTATFIQGQIGGVALGVLLPTQPPGGAGAGAGAGSSDPSPRPSTGRSVSPTTSVANPDLGPVPKDRGVVHPWSAELFDELTSIVATYLSVRWRDLLASEKGPALSKVLGNSAMLMHRRL